MVSSPVHHLAKNSIHGWVLLTHAVDGVFDDCIAAGLLLEKGVCLVSIDLLLELAWKKRKEKVRLWSCVDVYLPVAMSPYMSPMVLSFLFSKTLFCFMICF